jgi:hypothetical protein
MGAMLHSSGPSSCCSAAGWVRACPPALLQPQHESCTGHRMPATPQLLTTTPTGSLLLAHNAQLTSTQQHRNCYTQCTLCPLDRLRRQAHKPPQGSAVSCTLPALQITQPCTLNSRLQDARTQAHRAPDRTTLAEQGCRAPQPQLPTKLLQLRVRSGQIQLLPKDQAHRHVHCRASRC